MSPSSTAVIVAIAGLLHFPWGYFAGLLAWAFAAFGCLRLPDHRAGTLFAYLVAGSLLNRAAALGIMEMFSF